LGDELGESTNQLAPILNQIRLALEDIRGTLAGSLKDWLTVAEVADLTGRSAYTVRRWITEGRLTATRVTGTGPRGRLLVARAQLARLVAAGLAENVSLVP
jgi:excisionase family DNA binding protein